MQSWQGKTLRVEVPFSAAGVAHQVWVDSDAGTVLVDVGDGFLRDWLSCGRDVNDIQGVLITHGHYDHVGGLYSLLGFMRMIGRTRTLCVVGPRGCVEMLGIVRTFRECYEGSIPFEVEVTEVDDRRAVELDGMIVKAYNVVHCGSIAGDGILDRIPAAGYRIQCDGESVAITGDTGLCPEVKQLVAGAHLAVVEATFADSEGVSLEMLERVHLSEDLAKEVGELAEEYMLVHRAQKR